MTTTASGASIIAAALAAISGAAGAAPPAPRPIVLNVVDQGATVRITVKGLSSSAVDARYSLHVEGDVATGGNQSTQGGSVHLEPGREVTLISLALGTPRPGNWSAVLDVQPTGGKPYQVRQGVGSPWGRAPGG